MTEHSLSNAGQQGHQSQRFHLADGPRIELPVPAPPQVDLALKDLSPHIVAISLHNSRNRKGQWASDQRTQPRIVHLYEIEFFTHTGGIAVIDNCQYPISRGDIRFHRPGQVVWSHVHYVCYALRMTLDGTIPQEGSFQPLFKNPCLDLIPGFMTTSSPDQYTRLIDEMLRLSINPQTGTELLMKAKALELLFLLCKDANQLTTLGPSMRVTDTVTRAMDFMAAHYSESIHLPDIAAAANLSPYHFHRIFTQAVTMTPLTYLTRVRVERAREMLLTTQMPVSEIAAACGFENPSYFSRIFRTDTGQTPSLFRQHRQLL
jgi:AraC-like DNA-binding protein